LIIIAIIIKGVVPTNFFLNVILISWIITSIIVVPIIAISIVLGSSINWLFLLCWREYILINIIVLFSHNLADWLIGLRICLKRRSGSTVYIYAINIFGHCVQSSLRRIELFLCIVFRWCWVRFMQIKMFLYKELTIIINFLLRIYYVGAISVLLIEINFFLRGYQNILFGITLFRRG
jgi:hypothetical protein